MSKKAFALFVPLLASLVILSDPATGQIVQIPEVEISATGNVFSLQADNERLPADSLQVSAGGITCTLAGCELRLNAAGIIAFGAVSTKRHKP
ncbi:MAG: hypothetical protein AAF497_08475 [Planctomycetota bacterium]